MSSKVVAFIALIFPATVLELTNGQFYQTTFFVSALHRCNTSFLSLDFLNIKSSSFPLLRSNMFVQTAAGCSIASASLESYVVQPNICGSFNGTAPYNKYSVITTGAKAMLSSYTYMTSTCSGAGVLEISNLTVGGGCNRLSPDVYMKIFPITTAVPSTASSYFES